MPRNDVDGNLSRLDFHFRNLLLVSGASILLYAVVSTGPAILKLIQLRDDLQVILHQDSHAREDLLDFYDVGGLQVLEDYLMHLESILHDTLNIFSAKSPTPQATGPIPQSLQSYRTRIEDSLRQFCSELGHYRTTVYLTLNRLERGLKTDDLVGPSWVALQRLGVPALLQQDLAAIKADITTLPPNALTPQERAGITAVEIPEFWDQFNEEHSLPKIEGTSDLGFLPEQEAQAILGAAVTLLDGGTSQSEGRGVQEKRLGPLTRTAFQEVIAAISTRLNIHIAETLQDTPNFPGRTTITIILLLMPVLLALLFHPFMLCVAALVSLLPLEREEATIKHSGRLLLFSAHRRVIGSGPVNWINRFIRWAALALPLGTAILSFVIFLYLRPLLPRIELETFLLIVGCVALAQLAYETSISVINLRLLLGHLYELGEGSR